MTWPGGDELVLVMALARMRYLGRGIVSEMAWAKGDVLIWPG